MGNKIDADLIRRHGAALRGIDLTEKRAAEIAIEVERHNSAIRAAAQVLDFNDEPARFLSTLSELKQPAARPARKASRRTARK